MNATQLNTLLHCLRQIVNLTHAMTVEQQQQQHNSNNDAVIGGETGHIHALKLLLLNTTTMQKEAEHNNEAHDHDHEHEHEHNHDDDNNGLVLAKITAIVVLFFASAFCGTIPFLIERFWKLKNIKKSSTTTRNENNNEKSIIVDPHATTIVKCLLYFGGGVLLCTTFVHLLPEVSESVEQLMECGELPKFSFPLAELLMCVGFFLMYLIEELIHTYIHYAANKNNMNKNQQNLNNNNEEIVVEEDDMGVVAFARGHSIRRSCILNGSTKKRTTTTTTPTTPPTSATVATTIMTTTTTNEKKNNVNNDDDNIKTISTHDLITYDVEQAKYNEQQQQNHSHHHHHHHSHNHGHSHGHHAVTTTTTKTNRENFSASLRGLFIVLALSIHELFEGMAIGLEHSTASVWVMFGAVSAHKLVLAFCVGVELIVARTKLSLAILYIFTFAIVSPLGIAIGILVSNANVSGSNVVSVYLQGLACGTLLYVVFFEILSKNYAGLKALFALIVGFFIMFALSMLGEGGGHQHSHGSCGLVAETTTTTDNTTITNNNNINALGLNEQLQLLHEASAQLLQMHQTQTNA